MRMTKLFLGLFALLSLALAPLGQTQTSMSLAPAQVSSDMLHATPAAVEKRSMQVAIEHVAGTAEHAVVYAIKGFLGEARAQGPPSFTFGKFGVGKKASGFQFLSTASLILPYNNLLEAMGDSRTQQGAAISGTYGVSQGLTFDVGRGPDAMLGVYLGHKTRMPSLYINAGGALQSVEDILAYPRPLVSGVAKPDLDQVAAVDAGFVLFYAGTNDTQTANSIGGTCVATNSCTARIAITNAIAALTNPAVNWVSSNGAYNAPLHLAGGKPKTVIIINETPRGVAADGTTTSQALTSSDATIFESWATFLQTFDYASGSANANPRVIVIDAFHDSRFLDASHWGPGSSYLNQAGLLGDGIHPAPQGVDLLGRIVANGLSTPLANAPSFSELPTVATASSSLTPNPTFSLGTAASSALSGATVSSNLFPSGTTWLGTGTGTGTSMGTYNLSNNATASGFAVITTNGTGNISGTTVAGSNVLTVGTINSGASFTSGGVVTGAIMPASTSLTVSGNATGMNIDVAVNTVDGTIGNEVVLHVTGTTTAAPSISLVQSVATAKLNTVDLSTAYARGTVSIKYVIANANTVVSITPRLVITNGSAANAITAVGPLSGDPNGYSNVNFKLNLKNNFKDLGDGIYKTYTTPTVTLSNQGIASGTHPSATTMRVFISTNANIANDFTVGVRQMGAAVVSGVNG